jgi:hypothetical protein
LSGSSVGRPYFLRLILLNQSIAHLDHARARVSFTWFLRKFATALGRGDDLRIEGIPNGRQIRFKADFWRVGFGRRSTSG